MNTTTTQTSVTSDGDGDTGIPPAAFFAVIIGILLVIVAFAIFVGKYRLVHHRQRWAGPSTHNFVYSVTLHGPNGSTFANTIEGYLRESRRDRPAVDVERGDEAELRVITSKQITGLPSYEESMSESPDPPRASVKESPPPYTEN